MAIFESLGPGIAVGLNKSGSKLPHSQTHLSTRIIVAQIKEVSRGFFALWSDFSKGSGRPRAEAALRSELRDLRCSLEVDDETGGDARAIGVPAGGVEADIVHLWAEGQVRKQPDVHPATKAIGKLVESGAARSSRDARSA